jgi:hypothetical protein
LFRFNASTIAGTTVTFNISGLKHKGHYYLSNDTSVVPFLSSSLGTIQWVHNSWSEAEFFLTDATISPTVVTNASTGVEETNATLHGFLVDNGGENCTVGFDYGLTTGYGTHVVSGGHTIYPNSIGQISLGELEGVGYYRYAIKEVAFNSIPLSATFYVKRFGSPTGLVYGRIRWASNDSIYNSSSFDITTVSSVSFQYKTFTFTKGLPIASKDIYISIEYTGGSFFNHLLVSTDSSPGAGWEYANGVEVWEVNSAPPTIDFMYGSTGDTFNASISSLTPGKLYHFRAFATNSNGTGYGIDRTFLTKPNPPTGLTFVSTGNGTQTITWVKGTGANNTVIRAEAYPGAYPADPQSDISIYNNTGTTTTVNNLVLTPGLPYYYRAWSYTPWGLIHQFSDVTNNITKLTQPYAPTNATLNLTTASTVNLTWTRGHGANRTMIRSKLTGFPLSPTDGTLRYNGTMEYFNTSITPGLTYYFTAFSYTEYTTLGLSIFSYNRTDFTNITGGGLVVNCYDEETHVGLTFNILLSNPLGTNTQYNTSCTNPFSLNTAFCPFGEDIGIWISASGYRTRVFTMDLLPGFFLTLTAYLPRNTTNTSGGGGGGCTPQAFMDSMSISATVRDYVIPLTYRLHTMIEVQVYNRTLGYWVTVPTDQWTNNSNQTVTINESVLDSHNWNITMGRVSYYYLLCEGEQASYLYYFQVIVDPQGTTIPDASVTIKKYINATSTFETITNLYTDSNGFFNIWLVPSKLYKIICDKEGYNQEIVDFIPSTVTFSHTIKMTLITTIPQPPITEPESIHFTGELGYAAGNSTYYLILTYLDDSGYTNSTSLVITAYNFSTNSSTVIATYATTGLQTWTVYVYNIDRNMTYICNLTYVHFYLGTQHRSFILEHQIWVPITPAEVNDLFSWLGVIPFGTLNLIMWLLFVAICYYADSRDIGKIIIILGVIYLFLGVYIGLKTQLFGEVGAIAGGALPIIFIAMGILIEWGNSRRRM